MACIGINVEAFDLGLAGFEQDSPSFETQVFCVPDHTCLKELNDSELRCTGSSVFFRNHPNRFKSLLCKRGLGVLMERRMETGGR
ncbi:hypothetical protein CEXT_734041 [Caerostris extrusa]|uniref:Uncharacterized protein n=1 Tax=Caerostris extrusa TaxID=172846 RepID=A0AAV4XCR4_CAEEX|nr:hypothetical protein CEXT_734041 [Caerostris extrusa]